MWLSDRSRRWLAALALILAAGAARGESLAVTAAFDPEGRLWRLRVDGGRLQLDRSDDLGASFGPPVAVSAAGQPLAIGVEERPAIAFAGERVQVAYPVAAGAQGARLFVARSVDGGESFAAPQPLSDVPGRLHRFALDSAGRPYHLWYGDAGARGVADLHLAAAGQPPRRLAGNLCDCCRPAFAFTPDDRPVIAARFVFPGDIRDHGLLHPAATGPAPPLRVTFDDWRVAVCPIQGPALAIGAGGRYHLAWFTLGGHRGLFYAHSDDGGASFSAAVPFGDPDAHAMNPRVAAAGAHVTLAWQEFRAGRIRILARRSEDGGDTWGAAWELASTADAADRAELLAGPAGAFVSWNTAAEGYRLLAAGD
ncbi:MAG: sialidase family protein [Pseudomonadota bacterium]|jgi:hypothetical protein